MVDRADVVILPWRHEIGKIPQQLTESRPFSGCRLALPKNQIPIGGGLHPDGTPGADFFVDRTVLEAYEEDGPEWKFDCARFLEEAVQETDAIFEGLERPNHEDCFCYSVFLTRDPAEEDSATPPRYGMVFVAFVRRGFGYVVFDWGWRPEHPEMPGHPENWEADLPKRIWHKG